MELIRRANARPLGIVEFRAVRLEIGTGPGRRVLRIRTLRVVDGDRARTVFCVTEPTPMRNVNYVAEERRGRLEPFEIRLFLPFAGGNLRVLEPGRRREGLLGSDFTYDDFRTWQYEEGHVYDSVELVEDRLRVRGRCDTGHELVSHGTAPFDVYLDRETYFVRGIDVLSQDGAAVERRYRVAQTTRIDGVELPLEMRMTNLKKHHETSVHLEEARYDTDVPDDLFADAFRRRTADYLEGFG